MPHRRLLAPALLLCAACAAPPPLPAPARPPAPTVSVATPDEVCLPDDDLCVPVPVGWQVVSDTAAGAAGPTVRVDLLGPHEGRLLLRAGPALLPPDCVPTPADPEPPSRTLLPDVVLRASTDGPLQVRYLSRDRPAECAWAGRLFPSRRPGRTIEATALAPTRPALQPAADALLQARWRD